jgi:hypothetical protein
VRYADLPLLIYKNANAEEAKNTITQGRIISYQPRDDTKLNTTNKNVIEAINELKAQNDKLRAELDELKAKIPLTSNTGTTYWTGYSGGKLRELADYNMHVNENDMQIAEDVHMTFDHMMMKIFHNFLINDTISGDNINDKH